MTKEAAHEPKEEKVTHPNPEMEQVVEQTMEPKQEEVVTEATDQQSDLSTEFHEDMPKLEEATQESAEQTEAHENTAQKAKLMADLKPRESEESEGIRSILEEE